MSAPALLLVAHGTRDPRGVATVQELADAVRATGLAVHVAFVDVLGPRVSDVLTAVAEPVILVPAFLAAGYHVHTDVPDQVGTSGHRRVRVTPALGPGAVLARVQHARLQEAGWRPGDRVVLAAVGSADPRALADVEAAARLLSEELGEPVGLGYGVMAAPTVPDAVAQSRAAGAQRVLISPYLLAPGLFQAKLAAAGADATAAPLGIHPLLVDLVIGRYRAEARRFPE